LDRSFSLLPLETNNLPIVDITSPCPPGASIFGSSC
jgi:hypothetical protein